MAKLYPKYQRLMDSGEYISIEEMCNDLCLNYDDVYDYREEMQESYPEKRRRGKSFEKATLDALRKGRK